MTREEAKAEINKVFEPAFANYIITALTEGATPSERKTGRWIKFDGHSGKWFCECGCIRLGKHQYCERCGAEMVNWRE